MKRILLLILASPLMVFASASLTFSNLTVEKGNSFSIYVNVNNAAAWNLTVRGTGATSGCYNQEVGDSGTGKNTSRTFTINCRATKTGTINVSLTGDVTYANQKNININVNRTITAVTPRVRSSNNNLSSLGVKGFELYPKFSNSTKEYTVTVTPDVEEIEITGNKSDRYASISGLGKHNILDKDIFKVTVTSETGNANTFTIKVLVEDKNPIKVKFDDKDYIVNKQKSALPKLKLYESKEIEIDKFKIPALYNKKTNYYLVMLLDDKGNSELVRYKDGKYLEYKYIEVNETSLVLKEITKEFKGFELFNIKYDKQKIDVLKLSEKHPYFLIYAIDLETNKKDYYYVHEKEGTVQKLDMNLIQESEDNSSSKYAMLPYYVIITILITFIIIQFALLKKKN